MQRAKKGGQRGFESSFFLSAFPSKKGHSLSLLRFEYNLCLSACGTCFVFSSTGLHVTPQSITLVLITPASVQNSAVKRPSL